MIHAESALARGVKRFTSRALVQPYVYAAFDRASEHTVGSHMHEKTRGIVSGWPDSGTFTPGVTVWVEFKRPGQEPTDLQMAVAASLRSVGHLWGWADHVIGYAECLFDAGVPMLPTWRLLAVMQDELVAADIRKQEARRDGLVRANKPVRKKVSTGRIKRVEAARGRVLF